MLAMQDLTIATGEIKMATEMRRRLDALSRWVWSVGVVTGSEIKVWFGKGSLFMHMVRVITKRSTLIMIWCLFYHSERDLLLDKLGDLEDESAAVKVSLIQLLQEKSATNKTLALENFRLSQRVC